MMNAPESQTNYKEVGSNPENDDEWDEVTESSEGEDGYTEKIFSSALNDPEGSKAAKYILIKASKSTITVVTNHWERVPCHLKDCDQNAQHFHSIYNPRHRREYVRVIALRVCENKRCKFAPAIHVHQGNDEGKLDIDVPPRVFNRVWEGTMSLSMMIENLGQVSATVDQRRDPEHYSMAYECGDVSCSAYFSHHKHLLNTDPAYPKVPIYPSLYEIMLQAGRICEIQDCQWRETLHVHFPKNSRGVAQ